MDQRLARVKADLMCELIAVSWFSFPCPCPVLIDVWWQVSIMRSEFDEAETVSALYLRDPCDYSCD